MVDKKIARELIDGFFESNKYNSYCCDNEGLDYGGSSLDYLSTDGTCNGWLYDPRRGVLLAEEYGEYEYVLRKYLEQFTDFNQRHSDNDEALSKIVFRCAYVVAIGGGLIHTMGKECKKIGPEHIQEFWFLSRRNVEEVKKELDTVAIDGKGKHPIFEKVKGGNGI